MALTVREYVMADGRAPFRDWLATLTVVVRARIQARVLRFEIGNLGDCKPLGHGVWEARVMAGPGYRLYFGRDADSIILLLTGGDKGSQRRDILRARKMWDDYQEAKRHGKA